MIRGFKARRTERFFEGQLARAFHGFADQATRRLTVLDNAASLQDLAALPGNRLEPLSGDLTGQYSIRIIAGGGYASAGKTTDRTTWKVVDYH